MNTSLVKGVPPGEFVEISALSTRWQDQLQSLIRQKRPVRYDFYPLSKFPEDVLQQAAQHGYQHLILENDRWQHFFIPPASEFQHPAHGEPQSNGGNP